jgi:hypothetical protein
MKASTLIKKLKEFQDEYGDKEMYLEFVDARTRFFHKRSVDFVRVWDSNPDDDRNKTCVGFLVTHKDGN